MVNNNLAFHKELFKQKLKDITSCSIQYNGWTCGSCFYAISESLIHEDWVSLLLYRGDYNLFDLEKESIPKDQKASLNKIWALIR